jgi:oligosaccharide translocation protein RFT1
MSSTRDDVLNASLSSAYSLMGLQLFSRLFTFLLNQALFRMSSPQAFGTAAIQFELVLNTILFLSREGVRNTLLRAYSRPDDPTTAPSKGTSSFSSVDTSNIALLPLLFGFPLAIATTQLYRHFASANTRSQPNFDRAVSIYALSAILELLSEPMHNR